MEGISKRLSRIDTEIRLLDQRFAEFVRSHDKEVPLRQRPIEDKVNENKKHIEALFALIESIQNALANLNCRASMVRMENIEERQKAIWVAFGILTAVVAGEILAILKIWYFK